MGLHLGGQGSSVVAASLGKAHAAPDRPDIVVLNPDAHRLQAAFIIGARGGENDDKLEGLRDIHPQEGLRGNDKGADVQGGAGGRGNPVLVHGDNGLHRLDVVLLRNPGDAEAVVGVVGPLGIHVRAEKVVGPIIPLVGLQALEYLLRVVQDVGAGHEFNGTVGDDARVVPALALVVIHEEHMVGENLAEAELVGRGLFFGGGGPCYFNFFHFIVPSLNVSAGAPR